MIIHKRILSALYILLCLTVIASNIFFNDPIVSASRQAEQMVDGFDTHIDTAATIFNIVQTLIALGVIIVTVLFYRQKYFGIKAMPFCAILMIPFSYLPIGAVFAIYFFWYQGRYRKSQ